MAKERTILISQDQGQLLLRLAETFALPKKLGETDYVLVERGVASLAAQQLYLELRSRSPYLLQIKDRMVLFGPKENWEAFRLPIPLVGGGEKEIDSNRLKDPEKEIEIRLNKDAEDGAFWCLLMAIHPESPVVSPVSQQVGVVWPLIERLRLKGALLQVIGLSDAPRRRIDLDPEPENGKEQEVPTPVESQ